VILAEASDPKQAVPARITTHKLPPRISLSMEIAKVELEKAGLNVLARHMDIWTRPFVAPKEDGLGHPSFARTILKLWEQ